MDKHFSISFSIALIMALIVLPSSHASSISGNLGGLQNPIDDSASSSNRSKRFQHLFSNEKGESVTLTYTMAVGGFKLLSDYSADSIFLRPPGSDLDKSNQSITLTIDSIEASSGLVVDSVLGPTTVTVGSADAGDEATITVNGTNIVSYTADAGASSQEITGHEAAFMAFNSVGSSIQFEVDSGALNFQNLHFDFTVSEIDSDEDGIPDHWETRYGMDPFDPSDASENWDGDAYSNAEEYTAGIDPLDPNSSSGLCGFCLEGNDLIVLKWNQTLDERVHDIYWAPRIDEPYVQIDSVPFPGTSWTGSVFAAESRGFFKVNARVN